jgi:hypothetical protein
VSPVIRQGAFVIGGPVYRSMVHVDHMECVMALMALSRSADGIAVPVMAKTHYIHTSNLPKGRCEWLRDAIADRDVQWAVSVDSDTWFNAAQLLPLIASVNGDRAIGVVPMVIGGTGTGYGGQMLNINVETATDTTDTPTGNVRRAELSDLDHLARSLIQSVHSGGFGLAVFNLRWFRRNWPLPAPAGITFAVGEDIAMCKQVRQRGGDIVALGVSTVHNEIIPRPGQSIVFAAGEMRLPTDGSPKDPYSL